MPVMHKIAKAEAEQTATTIVKRGRGRPKGSKNKSKGADTTPRYTWACPEGHKQIMHIRCSALRCECGKAMKCADASGVLKI